MLKQKLEVHKLSHCWKMKINDVIECFNRVLDSRGNPDKVHYVAHSKWERKMGSVKTATTVITLYNPKEGVKEVVKSEYTTNIPSGQEEVLIEETQRRALTEFIKKWDHDTGT